MRVLLTGASGQLGTYVLDRLVARGHAVAGWSGREAGERAGIGLRPVDLADARGVVRALAEDDPEMIVHAAAISSAEAVRRDPERAAAVNVAGTARLVEWCRRLDRRMVFTSTDLVFDGSRAWWREDDPAEPILAYGRTKRAAELAAQAVPRGLVVRLSLLYGPTRCGREAFFDRTVAVLRRGESQAFFEDEYRTPLDYATAAEVLVALAESERTGLVHVAGRERVSRWELIRRAAEALGLDPGLVRANRRADVFGAEPRPADVSLDSARLAGWLPDLRRPTIEEAIGRLFPES